MEYQSILGQVSPYEQGRIASRLMLSLLVLLGIWKCIALMRRPETNTKCVLGLTLVLSGYLVTNLGLSISHFLSDPVLDQKLIVGVSAILMVGFAFSGFIIAVIGIIEFNGSRGQYIQGRGQAITALVISVLLLGGTVVGVLKRFGVNSVVRIAHEEGQPFEFEEANFRLSNPGSEWVRFDAKKFNPDATFGLLRNAPQVYFMMMAETVGLAAGYSNEALAELAQANVRSIAPSVRFFNERPARYGRADGIRFEAQAPVGGFELHYVYFVCSTNGYAYQLISWGRVREQSKISREVDRLYSNFDLIDTSRLAEPEGDVFSSDFTSERFGYDVAVANSWYQWADLLKDYPEAEFGAFNSQGTALAVVPVSLGELDPLEDALARGLISTLEFEYPSEPIIGDKSVVERDTAKGIELQYRRKVEGDMYDYRLRVLRNGGFGYLVVAWTDSSLADEVAKLPELLDLVRFKAAPVTPPDSNEFDESEKVRHATVFNHIGLFYHKSKQYEQAADFFVRAADLRPADVDYLRNVINAYSGATRYGDALRMAEEKLPLHADNSDLMAEIGLLKIQANQKEDARVLLSKLFADGYRDDNSFAAYLDLLVESKPPAEILPELSAYLAKGDSLNLRLIEADLLAMNGEQKKAIPLLKELLAKAPYNTDIAYKLIGIYSNAELHQPALDVCETLVRQRQDSATTYYLKAMSELGLKRYKEAKVSLESAQQKAPGDKQIAQLLEHVSGLLGEGANSGIKEPISAVAVPEALLDVTQLPAHGSEAEQFGATYLNRVTAISFENGKEFKTTDYIQIKVLDDTGVSQFSTIQFPFDPLQEQIFVNELQVRDSAGNVAATGKVDDYYVVDNAMLMASQKKTLNIPVPGLRAGWSIHLSLTRKEHGRPDGFRFTRHVFSKNVPVQRSMLYVTGNTESLRHLAVRISKPVRLDGGLLWSVSNPQVYHWEPYQSLTGDFLPTVRVFDATASWEAEVTRYLELIQDRLVDDERVAEFAKSKTSGLKTDEEKIAALVRAVQSELTYKAIEFGRRAQVPQKTAAILSNRYGDCKDHSLLLKQALQAAGIEAKLALVSVNSAIDKSAPALDQFDHMVVYVPQLRGGSWFDCTDKGSDQMAYISAGLAGRDVLVLDRKNPKFVRVPEYNRPFEIQSDRSISFSENYEMAVTETLTLHGPYAGSLRALLKATASPQWRSLLQEQMNNRAADISNLSIENLEQVASPLIIKVAYASKGGLQRTGDRLVGALPAAWERSWLELPAISARTSPFRMITPLAFNGKVKVRFPIAYGAVDWKPADLADTRRFASCQFASRKADDGIEYTYTLRREHGEFPAADYTVFQKDVEQALAVVEQKLVFTRPDGPPSP